MSDERATPDRPETPIAEEIAELARHLRDAEHLDPAARSKVAGLLRELAVSLEPPSDHTEHLAESAADLVRAVKDQHEPGLVEAARDRLEGAIARAEAKAPVATDIVLQLVQVLAGMGI